MEKQEIKEAVTYKKAFYDFGCEIKAVPSRFKFPCHDLQNDDSLRLTRKEVLKLKKPVSVMIKGWGFWMDASVKNKAIVLDKYDIAL